MDSTGGSVTSAPLHLFAVTEALEQEVRALGVAWRHDSRCVTIPGFNEADRTRARRSKLPETFPEIGTSRRVLWDGIRLALPTPSIELQRMTETATVFQEVPVR